MRNLSLLPFALCWFVTGCQLFGGVRIENVATASGKPSNVAALVTVTKRREPVRELDVSAFAIIEDGKPLDRDKADVRLLDPSTVVAFHTVLLLDLGHASTEENKRQLAKAASSFVRKVRQRQPVTVLVFDGSARTRLVGDFTTEPNGSGPEQLDNLLAMAPADPSRNLRGAVLDGLDALDSRLEKSTRPVHVGTLVVFSRGPDVAGRISQTDFDQRLRNTDYQLVYLDVQGDTGDDVTDVLARRNRVDSQASDTLPIAFEEAGALANRLTQQYYLISYCSPARASTRQLRIEVRVPGGENETETDSIDTEFDATGFTPGCNAGSPPRFVVKKRESETPPSPTKNTLGGKAEGSPRSTEPSSKSVETTKGTDTEVPPPNKPGYAP